MSETPVTLQQLREAQRASPFVPFTIHMADGRTFVSVSLSDHGHGSGLGLRAGE